MSWREWSISDLLKVLRWQWVLRCFLFPGDKIISRQTGTFSPKPCCLPVSRVNLRIYECKPYDVIVYVLVDTRLVVGEQINCLDFLPQIWIIDLWTDFVRIFRIMIHSITLVSRRLLVRAFSYFLCFFFFFFFFFLFFWSVIIILYRWRQNLLGSI